MTFIPLFGEIRNRTHQGESNRQGESANQSEEWHFASAFILSTTLLFLLIAGLLYIAAPVIVTLLAPGFHGEARSITITLFRIMVFTLAFLGPEAGLRGLFHTHREFATPDLSRFAYNLLLLFAVYFFSSRFGINSIGWGMVVGTAAMIGIQFARAIQLGLLKPRWQLFHPAMSDVLRKTPAVLIVLAWPMIMLLLDRAGASDLEAGSLASLGYASRIVMLPIGILVLSLSTALYPEFSDLANQGAHQKISQQLTFGLRMLLFVVLPACVAILIGRHEIVRLLFERGQFDAEATLRTSRLLFFYTFSVPGLAMIFFLRNIYLSLNKPWSLCLISIGMWICNIGLNMLLVKELGAEGIALATAVTTVIMVVLMLYILQRFHGLSLALHSLFAAIGKMSLIALGMAYLFYLLVGAINHQWPDGSMGWQLMTLSVAGGVSLVIYLFAAYIAKLPEASWISTKLFNK